jgi:putative transposase
MIMPTFARCYYHLIWTTKNRAALITPDIEKIFVQVVAEKSPELKCQVIAVNTVFDHVHLAVSIPPTLAVAEYVRHLKGTSTRRINEIHPDQNVHFYWQKYYGVLTLGIKHLPMLQSYIANQKEHHAQHTIIPYLEQCEDD